MDQLRTLVLVLNQNYEPVSVTIVKRALVLVYLGKAEIVENYTFVIHSVSKTFTAPSVVRILSYIHIRRRSLPLTKKNILKRDNYTCQYCGAKGIPMTTDHVIPREKGGQDAWENLVCACMKCNGKKGNRTPKEAGMKLLTKPKKPYFFFIIHKLTRIPDVRWKNYLFLS